MIQFITDLIIHISLDQYLDVLQKLRIFFESPQSNIFYFWKNLMFRTI